jgi:hypothetical protein
MVIQEVLQDQEVLKVVMVVREQEVLEFHQDLEQLQEELEDQEVYQ